MKKVTINTVEEFRTRIRFYSQNFNGLSMDEIRENENAFFDFIQTSYTKYFVGVLKGFIGNSFTSPYDFSNGKGIKYFCSNKLIQKIYEQKLFAFDFDESKGKPEAFLATVLKNELLDLISQNRRMKYVESVELSTKDGDILGEPLTQQPTTADFAIFAKKFPLLIDESLTELKEKVNLFICHPLVGSIPEYVNTTIIPDGEDRISKWRKFSEF